MIKIYHNPRCRKSREGLAILESKEIEFEVVKYLDNPLSFDELSDIISKLGIAPIALVRKNEAIWKENFKGKELRDSEVIQAMVDYPKLIERPIVVNQDKAVLGRPPENINLIVE
ncbi:MAG: arsenate reductase (glutaredoxin) [Flavobacteriaceae bacterium]|nr:arsenate reductase (glutaredoxin) [Flavobacteriaceae bacterium]|tara:strand:+ start:74661 stop:75005 length:345 start_codon:yes stop_codon:yes gene_type:complete